MRWVASSSACEHQPLLRRVCPGACRSSHRPDTCYSDTLTNSSKQYLASLELPTPAVTSQSFLALVDERCSGAAAARLIRRDRRRCWPRSALLRLTPFMGRQRSHLCIASVPRDAEYTFDWLTSAPTIPRSSSAEARAVSDECHSGRLSSGCVAHPRIWRPWRASPRSWTRTFRPACGVENERHMASGMTQRRRTVHEGDR